MSYNLNWKMSVFPVMWSFKLGRFSTEPSAAGCEVNCSSSSHTFSPLSVSPFLLLSGGVGSPCRGGEADGGARERGEGSGGENQVGSWGRNG